MNYLIELIIRPQRNQYNLKDLGDSAFSFSGQDFKRLDFTNGQIKNPRGQKISCSLWCPLESTNKDISTSPLIIYCHGNAGNKIDIIEIFEFLLWEFNICSFDFSGAGFSEGDYVTLGYYEKYDIQAVVEFLRKEFGIKNLILYGRSMGAVSSLRYTEMDPNIKACVLDSPFCHFSRLCEEILSNKFFIPSMMSRILINSAKKRILEKVEGFDIDNFIPANNARKVKVPTLLIHGKEDELVHISHSREIFQNINKNTYKLLLEVDGFHNDTRPPKSVNMIRDFMMQYSYDALILKEHRRRLNIKNAHFNFNAKYRIDINSIVDNFRFSQENSLFSSKSEMFNKNISNNHHNNFINYKMSQEISKANLEKINLDEEEIQKLKLNISNYQSENKREQRRMNNLKFDFNFKKGLSKKSKQFSKKIKQIIRSKSSDNSKRNTSSFLTVKGVINILQEFAKNTDGGEESYPYKKRNNSLYPVKNDKFYANTLFNEESLFDFDEYENFNFNIGDPSNSLNNKIDFSEDDIINEFSKGTKNRNSFEFNKNLIKNNTGLYENKFISPKKSNSLKDSTSLNNNDVKFDFNENNIYKNYFESDKKNEMEKNKTFFIDDKAKDYIDNSFISTQETNNYTDIYSDSKNNFTGGSGRGKIKTRRNQVLSGILNCDVKLGSSQITITDLDKTSLRKGRGSITNNESINLDKTFNN